MIIWLHGPSGSGKTTVGTLLARARGIAFIDLDEEVQRREGRTIEEIFWSDGEQAFRSMEWNALLDIVDQLGEDAVVSLGGGTVVDAEVRTLARAHGLRVFLDVDAPTALARLEGAPVRPLLMEPDPEAAWRRLYRARRRFYIDADLIIDASGDPASVVERIDRGLRSIEVPAWTIHSTLSGEESIVRCFRSAYVLQRHLDELTAGRKYCIVTDAVFAQGHPGIVFERRNPGGLIFTIDPGERSKTLATVEKLARMLAEHGMTKEGIIVAIGGGVVTDISGFTASVYMRGMRTVYVPTTLLGQVDASIGGKTAVNAGGVRNLLGTYKQPSEVLVATEFLRTLPQRELHSGFVEAIKMGIANSSELARAVEEATPSIIAGEIDANLEEVIRLSIETKLGVAGRDTHDNQERLSLNLGHTFGHALEAAEPDIYTHGEAVAFGIVAASALAQGRGLISDRRRDQIVQQVLPFTCRAPGTRDPAAIIAAMRADKKRISDAIRFVLPVEETGFAIQEVDDAGVVSEAIRYAFDSIATEQAVH